MKHDDEFLAAGHSLAVLVAATGAERERGLMDGKLQVASLLLATYNLLRIIWFKQSHERIDQYAGTNASERKLKMLLRYFYDPKLAQASYMVACQTTGKAVIIDPGRNIELYLEAAAEEGVEIIAATETHIHADFVSGCRELAERVGVTLYLSGEGGPDWQYQYLANYPHHLLEDGDSWYIGNIKFEAMHVPGHTPEHLAFRVMDGTALAVPMGIFSGDFVFAGDVGRPDLLETAAGLKGTKEESARALFQSLQRLKHLPDYLQIWPGHGAGSACGKALGAVPSTTLGYERLANWAFQIEDLDEIPANQPVLLQCQSGFRSNIAAGLLASRGRSNMMNLQGGIQAWRLARQPVVENGHYEVTG